MNCPNNDCSAEVPAHVRNCVVCDTDVGCPNVRAASDVEEVQALDERFNKAYAYAKSVGAGEVLESFCEAVQSSKAVISLPVSRINELVASDNSLYGTFYQGVEADMRLPEGNEWDTIRQSVDALVFPYYFEEIRFAALTLDGIGVGKFGGLSIVLKDVAVRNRSTVFEENTVVFVRKQNLNLFREGIPPGYRAVWDSRDKLATTKLSRRIRSSTTDEEYPSLLLDGDDFIEVHIYGPIHRGAIEKLTGTRPTNRYDRVIFKSIENKMREIDAEVEVK